MSNQHPLPSGFTWQTTAREVLGDRRLDGTTAIVTGGYAGIGLETTRVLAGAGATVIVPARTLDKARAALGDMAEVVPMDLAVPASIDAFARSFLASGRPLHLLVANAGIMAAPLARDERGFESHFATNHLGHFQLTSRLWPALVAAGGARIVALSSRGHQRAAVDFEDVHFERRAYDKWIAYGQSKTANVLFAVEADRRGQAQGIRAFAVHPGAIVTDLMRHMSKEEGEQAVANAQKIGVVKTVEQGAATSVWCATSEELAGRGGVYCEDTDIADVLGDDQPPMGKGVREWALDGDAARRLWEASERWIG